MNPDEFNVWYESTYKLILQRTFQRVQAAYGATREEAENGILFALRQFRRPGNALLCRVSNGDRPQMRHSDGSQGKTLLTYFITIASNAVCKQKLRRRVAIKYIGDLPLTKKVNDIEEVNHAEFDRAFRDCWAGLADLQQSVSRRRICYEEKLTSAKDRTDIAAARRSLWLCLVEKGWNWEELLGVTEQMKTIICGIPVAQ